MFLKSVSRGSQNKLLAVLAACFLVLVPAKQGGAAEPKGEADQKPVELQGDVRISQPTAWANAHYRIRGNLILEAGGVLTAENATIEIMPTYDAQFNVVFKGGKLITRNVTIGGNPPGEHGFALHCCIGGRGQWEATDTTVRYIYGIGIEEGFRLDAVRLKAGPHSDNIHMNGGQAVFKDSSYNICLTIDADVPGNYDFDLPIDRAVNTVFDSSRFAGMRYRLELVNHRAPFWRVGMRRVTMDGPPVTITLRDCPMMGPMVEGENLRGEIRMVPAGLKNRLEWPVAAGLKDAPEPPLIAPNTTVVTGNVTWRTLEKPAGCNGWNFYLRGKQTDVTLPGPMHIMEIILYAGKMAVVGTPGAHDAWCNALVHHAHHDAHLILRNVTLGWKCGDRRDQIIAFDRARVEIEDAKVVNRMLLKTTANGVITARGVTGDSLIEQSGRPGSITVQKLQEGQPGSTSPMRANTPSAGWVKSPANPVLGGALGTCFDVALLKEGDRFRMWFSWRPKKSVALVESKDGVHWSEPVIVLGPNKASGWEDDINRPVVVKRGDGYHMFYTGQARGHSWIGYATSADGKTWKRMSEKAVLSPVAPWEKVAVMCPHVIWDDAASQFRMWYSGGEQYEPDAIGYATSPDGMTWTKWSANPIFAADPKIEWERLKVTACQVVRHGGWHVMFYIGFRDVDHAQIGIARSRDGITGWQRLAANPIIRPGAGAWDADACYKPFAILDGNRWLIWYNGRRGSVEQIGLATHDGEDLGF